jgi:Ig domain of plant-specific actin-binding protein
MILRRACGKRHGRGPGGRLALLSAVATASLCTGFVAPAASYAFGPLNTAPPKIGGTAQQGQTLTETHGSWTNGPVWNYAYQWQRCNAAGEGCASISGASAETYAPGAADVGHRLRVQETASNFSGTSSPAESAATAAVVPLPPANTAPPSISGTAAQGQVLTEAPGSWTNAPTGYAVQWQLCNSSGEGCAPIAGASALSYAASAADVGHRLRVKETASNAGGSSGPVESQATAVVSAVAQAADPPAARAAPPAPLLISIRSVTVDSDGNAVIPVACPQSASAGCRGTITITVQVARPHAKRASAARCARGCRPLGTTNYQARAGQKVNVRVHIASFGRRLLSVKKSVRVTLTASSVADGQSVIVTGTISLKR